MLCINTLIYKKKMAKLSGIVTIIGVILAYFTNGSLISDSSLVNSDMIDPDNLNPEYLNKHIQSDRVIISNSDLSVNSVRKKRDTIDSTLLSVGNISNRLYSTCESITTWVANKTMATNRDGKPVQLLKEITHNSEHYIQQFLETKCVKYPSISGCLGIDTRFWDSYCATVHSFVKAVIMKGSNAFWDYIRIDTSCMCLVQMKCKNNDE